MNYFAHGVRFLDRPWYLAGTAVPDWLSVSDRRVRLRSAHVERFTEEDRSPEAELLRGILQHLEDDRWFHQTRSFYEVSGELARRFRELPGLNDGFRPGFLGHIAMELLLDAVLIDERPQRLERYYRTLAGIDPQQVQDLVNRIAPRKATRLVEFIPLFVKHQFLRDYLLPDRLLYRLNQVLRRVRLPALPEETERVLAEGRLIVQSRKNELLTAGQREAIER